MIKRSTLEGFIIGVISKGYAYVLYDVSSDEWVTNDCGNNAEDAGFVNLPDVPGVYRCTVDVCDGGGTWDNHYEVDYELRVVSSEPILVFPDKEAEEATNAGTPE